MTRSSYNKGGAKVEQRWSAPPLQRSRFCSTAPPAPPPLGGARWGGANGPGTISTIEDRPMTDTDLTPISTADRSAPLKVTGRLKAALDAMIWKGLTRDQAAEHAGLKPHSLYVAFRKPHVKAAYLAELEVLRTSERARNIHAMVKIRDFDGHTNAMASLNAAKALEGLPDIPASSTDPRLSPGITIRIISSPASQPPLVDVTPPRRRIEPT
jgi:hypothetical protein